MYISTILLPGTWNNEGRRGHIHLITLIACLVPWSDLGHVETPILEVVILGGQSGVLDRIRTVESTEHPQKHFSGANRAGAESNTRQ